MVRSTFFYIALASASLCGLGVATYFVYGSKQLNTIDATGINSLQELANTATSSVSAQKLITSLRAIKAALIRNPALKVSYNQTTFAWQRDVFDHLERHITAVLQTKPSQEVLAKILSLVDAIADEFEQDNAGALYNAEVDCVAKAWRNRVYDAISRSTSTHQPSRSFSTTHQALSPLQPLASRGAKDVQQKILLKDNALTSYSPSHATQSDHEFSPEPNSRRTSEYDFSPQDDYDDDLNEVYHAVAALENAAARSQQASQAYSSPYSSHYSSNRASSIPHKNITPQADQSKNTTRTQHVSARTPKANDEQPSTMPDNDLFGQPSDTTSRDEEKRALEAMQKFMIEFKEESKKEQDQAYKECRAALGI